MAQQNAIFGEFTKVRAVRRVKKALDKTAPKGLAAMLATFDPAPFGAFKMVRQVARA